MTCRCRHIRHTASGRRGRIVSEQRRFRTVGYWIAWDGRPRPTWHPAKVIEPNTRIELLAAGRMRFFPAVHQIRPGSGGGHG